MSWSPGQTRCGSRASRSAGTIWRCGPRATGRLSSPRPGLRGNYFNEIDRQSSQVELGLTRLQSWRVAGQEHLVKIGGQLFLTSFDGIDRSGPIDVRGADGRLLKRITFRGSGVLEASDVVSSGYVQDHWRVSPRLALDLGLRYDRSSMLNESHLSPRLAFSLALDASGRTLIKGGWGLFFDQIFLQVDAFGRFQQRVEQDYGGSVDTPLGPAVVFENRVAPEGFEEPTSRVWNIEFDRELGDTLLLRVNYRENRARHRLVIDRLTDATGIGAGAVVDRPAHQPGIRLYPDFPKGINTMYPYILRGKLSVRPAQVGGIDVNTLLSKLSWLLRIPNVDRILPLGRGATVRQGPGPAEHRLETIRCGGVTATARPARPNLDSICRASRCRSRR